jgi:hypothetical protein
MKNKMKIAYRFHSNNEAINEIINGRIFEILFNNSKRENKLSKSKSTKK